jgi:hypothetical protein
VKKVSKKPLVLSVVLHLLFVVLISYFGISSVYTDKGIVKVPAIKSYLYKKPKTQNEQSLSTLPKEKIEPETLKETEQTPKPEPQESKPVQQKEIQQIKELTAPLENQQEPLPQKTISTAEQIEKLRSKINRQSISQYALPERRSNTGSPLHGEPTLVPHSKKALTREEKLKAATLETGPNSQIIKGDNGNCTVINDLSSVGMEGIKSVQGFNCGENKFDRSFREHMNKVRRKLGKN